MSRVVVVNTQLIDADKLGFPYGESGFTYGMGLFESILVLHNKPILFDEHWNRLCASAKKLNLSMPVTKQAFEMAMDAMLTQNNDQTCCLNLYLTPTTQGKTFYERTKLYGICRDILAAAQKPIQLKLVQDPFPRSWIDSHKTMSYIRNTIVKSGMKLDEDVLFFSAAGEVLESTTGNVFFVKDGTLICPDSPHILPGITRDFIIDHQKEFDVQVKNRLVSIDELIQMDEVFLTSSLRGVILVNTLPIKNGYLQSQAVSRRLKARWMNFFN